MKTPRSRRVITILIGAGIFAAMAFGIWWWNQPGPLDGFASCLEERDAIFYGAFWCPHCQNQKGMFGRSSRKLPYIECSTPDGRSQLPVCVNRDIKSYPTWVFADESRLTGEVPLAKLAEKTGCTLP